METDQKEWPPPVLLKLFVARSMPGGKRALENLPRLREALGATGFRIEVVDSLERPGEADEVGIIVMPALSDESVVPARRLVCDLSDIAGIVQFFPWFGKDREMTKTVTDGEVTAGTGQVGTNAAKPTEATPKDGLARSTDYGESRFDLREATFRLVVDDVKDGILLMDSNGRIIYANSAAAKIFGRPCEELVNHLVGIIVPAEQELQITVLRPDHTLEEVELKAVEIAWNGQPAYLATLQDVSARRAKQEQLRQLQKLEMLGSLAAGITHDFRNLIAVVQSGLRLIGKNVHQGTPQAEVTTLIDEVMRRTQSAERLTEQLLAFSRKRERALRPVDVNRRIASVTSMLAQAAGQGIEIRTNLADDVGTAMIDAYELDVALLNLVINGRDAMGGGGMLAIETGVTMEDDDPSGAAADTIRVTVRDTGAGMAVAVKDRAFEPFFTTKGDGYGTGLGLNQVYGFVERSGGHIHIDSEEGVGTAVHLFLPKRMENDSQSTRSGPAW